MYLQFRDTCEKRRNINLIPPHFHGHVTEFLNHHLPQRWIRRGTDDDQMLLAWPLRSPDATPCDSFLWGYVKNQVYVPPTYLQLDCQVLYHTLVLPCVISGNCVSVAASLSTCLEVETMLHRNLYCIWHNSVNVVLETFTVLAKCAGLFNHNF